MSRRVRVFQLVEVTREGERPVGVGSLLAPACEQTLASDTPQILAHRVEIAPGARMVIYERPRHGPFDKFLFRLPAGGALHWALRTEDPAAPSLKRHWLQIPNLSCQDWVGWNSDDLLTIGGASDMTADNGSGLPALWTNASRAAGVVYSVAVFNPGADSVLLEWILL